MQRGTSSPAGGIGVHAQPDAPVVLERVRRAAERHAGVAPDARRLRAAATLFRAFHVAGVDYCHWKSNEHLEAGLSGETDLDILVDRRQYELAQRVFAESGFKRFTAIPVMGYPAIEDQLALDADTGRLVHCHVHYRLVAGERHLKGHRLPWERLMLERRVWDADSGVYIADPALEMLILMVRAATKLRIRDRIRHVFGHDYVGGDVRAEHRWLLDHLDPSESAALCTELLGDEASPSYRALLDGTLTLAKIRRFRRAARPRLDAFRLYGSLGGRFRRWTRGVFAALSALNRRDLRGATPRRRTIPGGGIMVAMLGPDGSGKSTAVKALSKTFAQKIDVCTIYFGSGDGPVSLLRLPLVVALRLGRRVGLLRQSDGATRQAPTVVDAPTAPAVRRSRRLLSAGRIVWALVLAAEKRRRLRHAWRARNLGMIVLTDRYPQRQILGYNDGPLLGHYARHSSALLRWIARTEAEPYRHAERYPPDLVVKFSLPAEVAVARKPDMTRAEIERRQHAVSSFAFGPETTVVVVDATKPMDVVTREVKQLVWNQI